MIRISLIGPGNIELHYKKFKAIRKRIKFSPTAIS